MSRLTDLDADVVQDEAQKGRLTDLDADVVQSAGQQARLVDLDVDVVQTDPTAFDTLSFTGGWGFIPIVFAPTGTYTDTYEDEY